MEVTIVVGGAVRHRHGTSITFRFEVPKGQKNVIRENLHVYSKNRKYTKLHVNYMGQTGRAVSCR